MNNENFVILPNSMVKNNDYLKNKKHSNIVNFSYFANVFYDGNVVEHSKIYSYLDSLRMLKYTFLEQSNSIKIVDLMKFINLDKIEKMASFKKNWNGNGGNKFTKRAIKIFKKIINMLDKQPDIAPTGRNSLFLQYELHDKSLLAFEVSVKQTEKVYIPKGDYSRVSVEMFKRDIYKNIMESVNNFYEKR